MGALGLYTDEAYLFWPGGEIWGGWGGQLISCQNFFVSDCVVTNLTDLLSSCQPFCPDLDFGNACTH